MVYVFPVQIKIHLSAEDLAAKDAYNRVSAPLRLVVRPEESSGLDCWRHLPLNE